MAADRLRNALAATVLGAFASASPVQAGCLATPEIFPATTLADLADFYYGDPSFQYAIMLATNTRTGAGFGFIRDPFILPQPNSSSGAEAGERSKVCVPDLAEAIPLRNRYETYLEALDEMEIASPVAVSDELVAISPGRPVSLATWIRSDQLDRYRREGRWIETAPGDIWVTVEPHLQEFCQAFVRDNGDDPDRLTLRLEQRLGLPPHNGKTTFLTFELTSPEGPENIFRPCATPDIETSTCPVRGSAADRCGGSNPAAECAEQEAFFNRQYYSSYGAAEPTGYPWTSLGYTFDWARQQAGPSGRAPFVRFGESEYVVRKGAAIRIVGSQTTEEYCAAEPPGGSR